MVRMPLREAHEGRRRGRPARPARRRTEPAVRTRVRGQSVHLADDQRERAPLAGCPRDDVGGDGGGVVPHRGAPTAASPRDVAAVLGGEPDRRCTLVHAVERSVGTRGPLLATWFDVGDFAAHVLRALEPLLAGDTSDDGDWRRWAAGFFRWVEIRDALTPPRRPAGVTSPAPRHRAPGGDGDAAARADARAPVRRAQGPPFLRRGPPTVRRG